MPKIIESQAKASLDESINQLDKSIEQKLAMIRQQALNQQTGQAKHTSLFQPRMLVSAFSLAVVALLLSSYVFELEVNSPLAPLLAQNEMVEDPDLLNDLEFIYWLSQENEQVLL